MKKKCVIFLNCHGGELQNHFITSKQFNDNYDIESIALYDYLEGYKYGKNNDLIEEHKQLIQTCDLIILQYIKKDRKIIHLDYIKSLLRKDCISILIPHYTFSGYQYPYNIINDVNINENITKKELQNYINNLFIDKETEIISHLRSELNHIKELDMYSDIKCYKFIKHNYNKKLLFYSRSYPTYVLFHYISQKILEKIGISDIIQPVWSSYASARTEVILPNVSKYLNLKFDITFNYRCNILEYIICCKKCNCNNLYLQNRRTACRNHVINIQDIISSKKYI